jgi:hypothetical protein
MSSLEKQIPLLFFCVPCGDSLAHSYIPFSFLFRPNNMNPCAHIRYSNHHAGNEWYRRLIKSNRPLYRACPKHTKLLVAKAVVQAVDQQGGRFLDKEKGSGLWYVVEYKRAVDKTSQGLRERERNGSDNDDDDSADNQDEMETTRTTMQDHDMSNPKADMTALARQISRKDPAPGGNRADVEAAAAEPGFAYEYAAAAATSTTTTAASAAAAAKAAANWIKEHNVNNSNSSSSSSKHKHSAAAALAIDKANAHRQQQQLNSFKTYTYTRKTAGATTDELDPLPPTMEPRQTSIFKFLQDTQLLAGPPGGQQPSNNDHRKPAAAAVRLPNVPNPNDRLRAQQLLQQAVQQQQLRKQQQASSSTTTNAAATDNNDAAAPSLTRFQSQVSDWLTSFWPVNHQGGGGTNAPAAATAPTTQYVRQPPPRKRKQAPSIMPEPTELETGASQVLLQMATSSKLFRGFSSLFEDPNIMAAGQPKQPPPPASNDSNKKPRSNTAATTDSLLDDYEESPMDARLRHVK